MTLPHSAVFQVYCFFIRADLEEIRKDGDLQDYETSILSDISHALLREFCLRYGIKELYHQITVLEVSAE